MTHEARKAFQPGRVFRIMDLLRLGVPASDIPSLIDAEVRRKGKESEERAIRVLGQLEIVIRIEKGDELQDSRQVDLVTQIKEHSPVYIQVKSSEISLQRFYQRFNREKRREKRLMGINAGGEASDQEIQETFMSQLRRMDGFI